MPVEDIVAGGRGQRTGERTLRGGLLLQVGAHQVDGLLVRDHIPEAVAGHDQELVLVPQTDHLHGRLHGDVVCHGAGAFVVAVAKATRHCQIAEEPPTGDHAAQLDDALPLPLVAELVLGREHHCVVAGALGAARVRPGRVRHLLCCEGFRLRERVHALAATAATAQHQLRVARIGHKEVVIDEQAHHRRATGLPVLGLAPL
mmetsp:Transcript_28550/g.71763  ORF Transcript_28550/g.71763 Transcript_28550/m.71763 type:complete len:202 (-) Transcript_28550:681-1286(-)